TKVTTEPGAVEAVNKLLNALIDAALQGVELSAYYSSPVRNPTRRLGYLEPERIVARNKQFIHSFGPLPVLCWLRVGTVMVLIAASTSVVFYRHSSKERLGSESVGTKGGKPPNLPFKNSQLLAESARPTGVQARCNAR